MDAIVNSRELAIALPVLVVWIVGLVFAIVRWRNHPQVSRMVVIACAVGLFIPFLTPVAMSVASKIHHAFFPPLISLIHICLTAFSIGLLLNAAFLGRREKVSENVKKADEIVPTVPRGVLGIALGILAGIARWAWRLMSVAAMLFAGTFILGGPSQGILDLGLMVIWVIIFALLIWVMRCEGMLSLILLVVVGIPTVIDMITNLIKSGRIGQDAPGYFVLIMSMLVVVSWALHALNNISTSPGKRRLALITAPVLAVAIVVCVVAMRHAPFNP